MPTRIDLDTATEIAVEDRTLRLRIRRSTDTYGRTAYGRKARLYVSVPDTMATPAFHDDEAWKAFRKEQIRNMRRYVPGILAELGIENARVRFSQKAGCGCGCSPGFIVDGFTGRDIFATDLETARAAEAKAREAKVREAVRRTGRAEADTQAAGALRGLLRDQHGLFETGEVGRIARDRVNEIIEAIEAGRV